MSGKAQFHFLGFVGTISCLNLMKQILFLLMYALQSFDEITAL